MKSFTMALLLATGALFSQCAKTSEPAPKVDYDQKSAEIVQAVSPSLVGDWTLRRVHITAQPYNSGQRELGIVRDTTFENFATLSIQAAPSGRSIPDLRYAKFTGLLHYRTKTYPAARQRTAAWGLAELQVVTQLDNEPACGFYRRCGFREWQVEHIYHLWL